jgi:hypothetical protein
MFKNSSYIYSDLIIAIDTCNINILNCIKKQQESGRIRVLSKSKPYKVGNQLYTLIKYVRNNIN